MQKQTQSIGRAGAFWRPSISGWFPTGIYPCLSIAAEQNKKEVKKPTKRFFCRKGSKGLAIFNARCQIYFKLKLTFEHYGRQGSESRIFHQSLSKYLTLEPGGGSKHWCCLSISSIVSVQAVHKL